MWGFFGFVRRLFFPAPPAPWPVGVEFRPRGDDMQELVSSPFVFAAPPPAGGSRLITYTVNGSGGGVISASDTFTCSAGDVIAATAVDTSAGGVSSVPSATFTVTAHDNVTVPATPVFASVSFSPAPTPTPTPTAS